MNQNIKQKINKNKLSKDSASNSEFESDSESITHIQNDLHNINIEENLDHNNNIKKSKTFKNKSLIYIRSSSKSQNDEENNKNSYDNQLSANMKYLKENKLNIMNISFQTKRACNIKKHLDYYETLKSGNYNHLIVSEPSRLSRTYREGMEILKICDENDITIHCSIDKITSATLYGRNKIIKGFKNAEIESNLVSLRIKNSVNQRKNFGSKIGSSGYGYNIKKNINNSIGYPVRMEVPKENEQKMISLIKMLYFGSNMIPINTIFRELINDQNYYLTYHDQSENKLKKYSKILFGHFRKNDIANILNQLNLLRRDKLWSCHTINNIINRIKNDYLTQKIPMVYHQEDGLAYHYYHNDHLSMNDKKRFHLKKFTNFPELKKIYEDGDDYENDDDTQNDDTQDDDTQDDHEFEFETQDQYDYETQDQYEDETEDQYQDKTRNQTNYFESEF